MEGIDIRIIIRIVFHLLCGIFTLGMVINWSFQYMLDEDLSWIKYKHYQDTEEDVYPVLSLCFANPFIKNVGPSLNKSFVGMLLKGQEYDNRLLALNYDKISFNLEDFAQEYWFRWQNGSSKTYPITSENKTLFNVTYTGVWRNRFYNCYGIKVPMEVLQRESNVHIEGFAIHLSNKIFPESLRPSNMDFTTFLHYPNQLLLSLPTVIYQWKNRRSNSTYNMRHVINGMEILKRRKKANFPCDENWKYFDDHVIEKHTKKFDCRAIYHKKVGNKPLCDNKTSIHQINFPFQSDELKNYAPPCKGVEKIHYTYEEYDLSGTRWFGEETFWVTILLLDSRYKEIVQTRYVNIVTTDYQPSNRLNPNVSPR